MEKEADAWFDEEKIDPEKRSREYFLDMRYKGQNHEIRVPIEKSIISSAEEIRKEFTSAYERLYSFSSDDAVQIVNFGLSAIGDIIYPVIHEEATDILTNTSLVYEGNGAYSDYDLYDREKLRNGNVVYGPAIVEQMDSTTIILKGQKATVDQYLNMMIERV